MIVEENRNKGGKVQQFCKTKSSLDFSSVTEASNIEMPEGSLYASLAQKHLEIRNKENHFQLRDDLIEHLWSIHGKIND